MHFGVSKRNGAPGPGSGRYPLGSGENPRAGKVKASSRDNTEAKKLKKQQKYLAKRAKELKKTAKYEAKVQKELDKIANQRIQRDKKFVNQTNAKDANKLSNEELQERIARLQQESNYKQKMKQARGKEEGWVKQALKGAATTAITGAASAAMIFAGKQALARILKAEPDWMGKVINEETGEREADDLRKKYKEIMQGFKTGNKN